MKTNEAIELLNALAEALTMAGYALQEREELRLERDNLRKENSELLDSLVKESGRGTAAILELAIAGCLRSPQAQPEGEGSKSSA